MSEWINGGDLLYLSLPAIDAVKGFIIGDVIDKYGSMSTSEVTLHIVITHQLAGNLALQIIRGLLIPPSQYKHNCTMNVPDLKGANLQMVNLTLKISTLLIRMQFACIVYANEAI